MLLKGSCHCEGGTLQHWEPSSLTFMHCYCSVAIKLVGAGGYLSTSWNNTYDFKEGEENISIYRAHPEPRKPQSHPGEVNRCFCHAIVDLSLWGLQFPTTGVSHPFADRCYDSPKATRADTYDDFLSKLGREGVPEGPRKIIISTILKESLSLPGMKGWTW